MLARCQAPFPSGARACELDLPPGYERHRLVTVELHLHGLHGRTIEVPPAEVAAAWDAAEYARKEAPAAAPPEPPPPGDGGVVDSGSGGANFPR
jgi:hypothetical protein